MDLFPHKTHGDATERDGYLGGGSHRFAVLIAVIAGMVSLGHASDGPDAPAVGERAPDFALKSLEGETVRLRAVRRSAPVVVVVLRGYPGYQCPICTKQFANLRDRAEAFKQAGARVLLVYPGPEKELPEKAHAFVGDAAVPSSFTFLTDPGYGFTRKYGLRWDAPKETAYPSAFVIDRAGVVRWRKVSEAHGGRATAEELLDALGRLQADPTARKVGDILQRVRDHAFHPVRDGFTYDRHLDKQGVASLGDRDWRVRTLALRDLARLGRSAVPPLIDHLEADDWHVRYVSAKALGFLGDLAAAAPLQSTLKEGSHSVVRSQAALSLGQLGAESTLPLLDRLADRGGRDVAHQCEVAAHRIRYEQPIGSDVAKAYAQLDPETFERVEVGKPAPDFSLRDTQGRRWRLSDFRGRKPVVLLWIFADWCPVCHHEFDALIQQADAWAELDVKLFTVECHDRFRCRLMTGEVGLRPSYWFKDEAPQGLYAEQVWWPHLVDPAGKVGATYGVDPLAFVVHSEPINRPATIVVDKEGVVRFAYYGTYWGDRPSIERIRRMVETGDYELVHPDRLEPAGSGSRGDRPE